MTYDLILGDYAYSSWSLRGWLLFERFGIARRTEMVNFKTGGVPEQMPDWAPAKTVPAASPIRCIRSCKPIPERRPHNGL